MSGNSFENNKGIPPNVEKNHPVLVRDFQPDERENLVMELGEIERRLETAGLEGNDIEWGRALSERKVFIETHEKELREYLKPYLDLRNAGKLNGRFHFDEIFRIARADRIDRDLEKGKYWDDPHE